MTSSPRKQATKPEAEKKDNTPSLIAVDPSSKSTDGTKPDANTENVPLAPNMQLPQWQFLATSGPASERESYKRKLFDAIKKDGMVPYYEHLCPIFGVAPDASLVQSMKSEVAKELERIDTKLKDAEENLGETEIADALLERANYLTRTGERTQAVDAQLKAQDKIAGSGAKIDVLFSIIRTGFFYNDFELMGIYIDKAKGLIAKGGDWDRRNRLKVYEGIYCMAKRDFAGAAALLLDTLSTFTCTEMLDYKTFVKYAVISGAISLGRQDMKSKIMESPEVLEVIHELPYLQSLVHSLYECKYAAFFSALGQTEQELKLDRFTAPHFRVYAREMRIRAYSQLLESYRSVTLSSMAEAFGVTEDFIDRDLSKFVSSQRVHAVIDKVGGIVETNRPDAKNAQYQQVIKLGDNVINKVQKLSRVITV